MCFYDLMVNEILGDRVIGNTSMTTRRPRVTAYGPNEVEKCTRRPIGLDI